MTENVTTKYIPPEEMVTTGGMVYCFTQIVYSKSRKSNAKAGMQQTSLHPFQTGARHSLQKSENIGQIQHYSTCLVANVIQELKTTSDLAVLHHLREYFECSLK